MKRVEKGLWVWVIIVFIWSGYEPYDRLTWFLEVLPVILGCGILYVIRKKFNFTTFTLYFIVLEMIILMIGGKYSYARMPVFEWIKEIGGLDRNYYDRLGHFAQGFIPALIIREILMRFKVINGKGWLKSIIIAICLAISASYELLEFLIAKILGSSADEFLGMQGSIWDTQWDMTFALVGAIVALCTVTKYQDKYINEYKKSSP